MNVKSILLTEGDIAVIYRALHLAGEQARSILKLKHKVGSKTISSLGPDIDEIVEEVEEFILQVDELKQKIKASVDEEEHS